MRLYRYRWVPTKKTEMTPGPVVRTTEEIISYIKNLETEFDREKVRRFREKFMSACDGDSTQRILAMAEKMEVGQ